MKKCPFCAEEIQEDAIICRFCGKSLDEKAKTKWYFKPASLIISFLCVGPFMLPLVWFSPYFTPRKKIIITGIVIIVTCFLSIATFKSLQSITKYYQMLPQ